MNLLRALTARKARLRPTQTFHRCSSLAILPCAMARAAATAANGAGAIFLRLILIPTRSMSSTVRWVARAAALITAGASGRAWPPCSNPATLSSCNLATTTASALNDTNRARGTIKGVGDESQTITNRLTGKVEDVRSFGWYEENAHRRGARQRRHTHGVLAHSAQYHGRTARPRGTKMITQAGPDRLPPLKMLRSSTLMKSSHANTTRWGRRP